MATTTLLALMIAAAAAQPPPPVAAAERAQWALVRRVNSEAAFETYLRRFPAGRHAAKARRALGRLGAGSAVAELPPWRPTPPPATGQPDPCMASMSQHPAPPDAVAYQAAIRDNRLAELRRFLADHPQGACRASMERLLAARAARRAAIVSIPGLGPLPPHPRTREIFMGDDYPAVAIRAEATGATVAVWDVAEDGAPEACRIAGSSGSEALDRTTCAIIVRRMSYDPARDAAGNPVRGADSMRVRWVLPDELPEPPPRPPRE